MEKNNIVDYLENIQEESLNYVETSIDYFKLFGFKIIVKSTNAMVSFIFALAIGCLALLLLSISAAFAIGSQVESVSLGFLIVGSVYVLLLVLFFMLRKRVIEPAIVKIWSKILYNDK